MQLQPYRPIHLLTNALLSGIWLEGAKILQYICSVTTFKSILKCYNLFVDIVLIIGSVLVELD